MKRTTIFMPEALERDVRGEAARTGQPVASLVREALAEYIAARRTTASQPSFVGCGAGSRTDVAETHEQLLWTDPHGVKAPVTRPRPAARRRKAR
ncbi:MAG TPA: hypothetical protein VNJ03_09790 [Vicinamibacterales bacterium]|nr:hypothetical protein [Vicinamibacterales bacterium]